MRLLFTALTLALFTVSSFAAGKEVAPPYHPANGPHGFYVGLPRHIPETDEATRQEIAFIKKELCDNLNRPNLRVLLDCKNVDRMSTAAVTMIREFYRWLRPWGSKLCVCRLHPNLSGVMPALEEDLIPYYADKKVAISAKW